MSYLLAIDPGIGRCGYAIMCNDNGVLQSPEYGCIETTATLPTQERIAVIYKTLALLIEKYHPTALAIEELFAKANVTTVMRVSQVQGAILLLAAQHNLTVHYFKPNEIKLSVAGYGNADKTAVQKMVQLQLGLAEIPQPDDTADALACGIAYLAFHPELK